MANTRALALRVALNVVSSSTLIILYRASFTVLPKASLIVSLHVLGGIVFITLVALLGMVRISFKPLLEAFKENVILAIISFTVIYSSIRVIGALGVNTFIVLRTIAPCFMAFADFISFRKRVTSMLSCIPQITGCIATCVYLALKHRGVGSDTASGLLWSAVWLAFNFVDFVIKTPVELEQACSDLESILHRNLFVLTVSAMVFLIESTDRRGVELGIIIDKAALLLGCIASSFILKCTDAALKSELSERSSRILGVLSSIGSALLNHVFVTAEMNEAIMFSLAVAVVCGLFYQQPRWTRDERSRFVLITSHTRMLAISAAIMLCLLSFRSVHTATKWAVDDVQSNVVARKKFTAFDISTGTVRADMIGIPKWPKKSASEEFADSNLRRALESDLMGPLKADPKPEPPGWVSDYSHLKNCTSCFEREYMQSVHAIHSHDIASLGRTEIIGIDDHAIELWKGVSRVLESPTKSVTDLACPGPNCIGGDRTHLERNHFGMYGSAVHDGSRFQIWLGNWVPYFSSSIDGLHWLPLQELPPWVGYKPPPHGDTELPPDNSARVPTNLCVTLDGPRAADGETDNSTYRYKMGFHCGNYTGWESTCLAHSPDGINWTPYHGKRHCGPACKWAADTTNCLFWYPGAVGGNDTKRVAGPSYRLINRRNYGTPAAWREVRGVRVSAAVSNSDEDLGKQKKDKSRENDPALLESFDEISSWYFDRLGKGERFQRQMYSLSISTDIYSSTGLHLGIATVLEWPKVPNPTPHPPWQHDVTSIYLLPTRDGGMTFDLDWVYTGSPLISRGGCNASECEFDHGYLQAASEFVTVNDTHWLFYEGRTERHEDRWKKPATIAAATWRRHRFAAIRPARVTESKWLTSSVPQHSDCGLVVTKPFQLAGSALHLNVAIGGGASTVIVAVLRPNNDNAAYEGFGEDDALVFGAGVDSLDALVTWRDARLGTLRGKRVRLLFRLCGDARLYAFTILP